RIAESLKRRSAARLVVHHVVSRIDAVQTHRCFFIAGLIAQRRPDVSDEPALRDRRVSVAKPRCQPRGLRLQRVVRGSLLARRADLLLSRGNDLDGRTSLPRLNDDAGFVCRPRSGPNEYGHDRHPSFHRPLLTLTHEENARPRGDPPPCLVSQVRRRHPARGSDAASPQTTDCTSIGPDGSASSGHASIAPPGFVALP